MVIRKASYKGEEIIGHCFFLPTDWLLIPFRALAHYKHTYVQRKKKSISNSRELFFEALRVLL